MPSRNDVYIGAGESQHFAWAHVATLLDNESPGGMEARRAAIAREPSSNGASGDPRRWLSLTSWRTSLPAGKGLLGPEEKSCGTTRQAVCVHIAPHRVASLGDSMSKTVEVLDETLQRPVERAVCSERGVEKATTRASGPHRHLVCSSVVFRDGARAQAREEQEVFP